MLNLNAVQEKLYLPLRALWVANNGVLSFERKRLTRELLTDMDTLPEINSDYAIILGSTRATVFLVEQALQKGRKNFILIGQKPIDQEHPLFTKYLTSKMTEDQRQAVKKTGLTECDLAETILLSRGIHPHNIHRIEGDNSMYTGQNMSVLRNSSFGSMRSFEFFGLSGFARRALMTARQELPSSAVIKVHNCYPSSVTDENWFHDKPACAFMVSEAIRCLGNDPLYVRLGYCKDINLEQEKTRILLHTHKSVSVLNQPAP
jgi:hypothetical protein